MNKRKLLMDLLSNAVAFLLVFNIFMLVYTMLNGEASWLSIVLIIPFFFLFFLRQKIKKMKHFVALHIIFLAAPFIVLDDVGTFIPLLGFAIVSVIYSISTKGKGEWPMPGVTAAWVIGVFAALSMLFAVYVPEVSGIGALLNISSLISLAAIILYMHLDNLGFSLAVLKEHQKKAAQTTTASKLLITIFLVMVLVFGALSILFPSESAVLIVGRLLLEIVTLPIRLLALFAQLFVGGTEGEGAPMPPILMMGDGMVEETTIEENLLAFNIVSTIMAILTTLIVIVAASAIIGLLFRGLYRAFNKKDVDSGRQSLMPDDVTSKLKFVFGDIRELLPRFKLGVKHPVRRAYIKKINGHIKQGFKALPHYTPEVIADKIRPKEDIDELTQKYEVVRYGRG